jgi:hypothetical protein
MARFRGQQNPPFPVCRRSGQFKPPRSHYDSVTSRLVLNMDHFCPWVANTVGFYNKKFFILFVSYACITCAYSALVLLAILSTNGLLNPGSNIVLSYSSSYFGKTIFVMSYLAMIVDATFALALLFFAGVHWYMASRNQTSIEGYDSSKMYDLGASQNLKTVFGENRRYWFLPVFHHGPLGDGVHWETIHGNLDGSVTDEQEYGDESESDQLLSQSDGVELRTVSIHKT